ncbi:MAG: hypothetical protein WED09_07910 [Homoserinimonas sp.]
MLDSIGPMIPGDTGRETFFLRNTGDAPAFLRVTLREVTSDDTDFLHALTISASTPTRAGTPVVLGAVDPCWVLVKGQTIGVGETVAVTAVLSLGNLDGMAGQGATARALLRVSLDDISAGIPPPTDCGGAGVDVPILSPPRSAAAPGAAAAVPQAGSESGAQQEADGEASADLPVLNLPGGIVIDPNTWHLHEEYLVLILLTSLALGSGWFMIVARRRREHEDQSETDVMA